MAIFAQTCRSLTDEVRMANIDLINWTIREAQNLRSDRHQPSNVDDPVPSLEAFLAMIESETWGPNGSEEGSVQNDGTVTNGSQTTNNPLVAEALPHDEAGEGAKRDASKLPSSGQAVPSTRAEQRVQIASAPSSISVTGIQIVGAPSDNPPLPDSPKVTGLHPVTETARSTSSETQKGTRTPALLMAIRQADYRTLPTDRERAIVLRWALRDIQGKRLNWSPISQDNLDTLIEFGLVEMQSDLPTLTQEGASAIA
jgi:hypothetical protein